MRNLLMAKWILFPILNVVKMGYNLSKYKEDSKVVLYQEVILGSQIQKWKKKM